jgi:hypothetical protein
MMNDNSNIIVIVIILSRKKYNPPPNSAPKPIQSARPTWTHCFESSPAPKNRQLRELPSPAGQQETMSPFWSGPIWQPWLPCICPPNRKTPDTPPAPPNWRETVRSPHTVTHYNQLQHLPKVYYQMPPKTTDPQQPQSQ